jgi:hypothetical protein
MRVSRFRCAIKGYAIMRVACRQMQWRKERAQLAFCHCAPLRTSLMAAFAFAPIGNRGVIAHLLLLLFQFIRWVAAKTLTRTTDRGGPVALTGQPKPPPVPA